MAIRLTVDQIEALKFRVIDNIVVWRPLYSRNVHIRSLDTGWWTFCNELRPLDSSHIQWKWEDNFCALCVERAFRWGKGEKGDVNQVDAGPGQETKIP